MDADEYAQSYTGSVKAYQAGSARTALKHAGRIGASDFDCRERLRRILLQMPETDETDMWAAYVGTCLDIGLKQARKADQPHLIIDAEWPINLNGFIFDVHPDEVDPTEPSVSDGKSKDGLALVRSKLEKDPARIQRHLQYEAGIQNGVLPAEGGIVRNVYVDRSGADPTVHVEQEPYSREVVVQAESILGDVLYAIENNERASQDRPRNWCENYCPFVSGCRGGEITTEEIDDPEIIGLVEAYHSNHEVIAEAKQLEDELKFALRGVGGHTPSGLRAWWTQVNAAKPYLKFSVKRQKTAKAA